MKGYELAGYCGVDSGQILFTDPCYLDRWKPHSQDDNFSYNEVDPLEPRPYSYEGACNATLSTFKAGQLDEGVTGVCVSSGYGDGTYPVYIKKNYEGRIVEAVILFDYDEEDEVD